MCLTHKEFSHEPSVDMVASKSVAREHKLCNVHHPIGKTTQSSYTNSSQQVTNKSKRKEISNTCQRFKGAEVVAEKYNPDIPNPPERGYDFYNNRCSEFWMGRRDRERKVKRFLESTATCLAQQSKGTVGGAGIHQEKGISVTRSNRYGTNGQQNGGSLHHETGRHQVPTAPSHHSKNSSFSQRFSYKPDSKVYSREVQRDRRQSIPSKGTTRMVVKSRSSPNDLHDDGDTRSRLICQCKVSDLTQIRQRRCQGSELSVCRCLQPTMELQPGLGVSTTSINTPSPETSNLLLRNLSSGSPKMGENILESRIDSENLGSAVHDPQSTREPSRSENQETTPSRERHVFAGLENTGWSRLLETWATEDRNLLETAWRKSTLKTYKPAWTRWRCWAKDNSVKVDDPNPENIAKYICYLHQQVKLAARSIALHKSVVVTFAKPDNTEYLSNHPVVRQTLRAIFLSQPPVSRPLTWEVGQLIDYLKTYSCNVDSLFQVSRHVAALLLLSSGRRVHDLTLLDIGVDCFEAHDDHIIFWPKFGSKTDSINFRQSGWKLAQNKIHKLDVTFWIKKLIDISKKRRNSRISRLFITTRGQVKAASRTVISGWLRSLFKSANITASPGSFRAAVNTDIWSNRNCNLEEVLCRGNWRSKDTFLKYYFKEIPQKRSQPNTDCLSESFTPL
ncbi:uncharacterized protein [Maniola hyperantus]|uniref:uncharacterized protein n=1 Tax=Aphantopus hyperantus TaxID=2795564 RepID=UPI00374A4DA2